MTGAGVKKYKTVVSGVILTVLLGACAANGASNGQGNLPDIFQDAGGKVDVLPSSTFGEYLAGREALREQEASVALDYFEDALEKGSTDAVLVGMALQAALAKGDIDRAVALAPQALAGNEENSAASLVLAIDALARDDFTVAGDYLAQTGDNGFNVLLKPLLMSWVRLALEGADAAFDELDALDRYNGFEALKEYQSALLADVSGNTLLADQKYSEALAGPSGRTARLVQSYGAFLDRTGRRDMIGPLFDAYLDQSPMSPIIQAEHDKLAAGQPLDPVVTDARSGAAEALYSAASIIGQERAIGVAATYIHFALRLEPGLPMARMLLAETAEDRGNWQEAFDLYSSVHPESPYGRNAEIRAAWAAYKLGREEEARARLEAVAAADPDNIEALVVLADVSRDSKAWAQAADEYGRAIDRIDVLEPRHWSLFYARGVAYEQSRQWPLAEKDLIRSLELRPDHPQVLNYLAYSWVDRNENLDRAREMLIKAVSLRPRDGYIVDSLGWLYYRLGEYDNAVIQLEKAVSLEAADPTITDHLADAYWRVGRREEARYQWQRALWLEPTADQIPVIEDKLKHGLRDAPKAEK